MCHLVLPITHFWHEHYGLAIDGCIVWNAHNTVFGSKRAVSLLIVCRRFDDTRTSSGHAHLDRQRYEMACCVTRERASDVANNLGTVSCTECTGHGNDFELIQTVRMETRHPI